MATRNTHLPIKHTILNSIFEFFWISLWKKKNNKKKGSLKISRQQVKSHVASE